MESSVCGSTLESKDGAGELQDLDKHFLTELLEWGRKRFVAMLEEMDATLLRFRDNTLRIVRQRAVWYRTCLGNGQGAENVLPGTGRQVSLSAG